MHKVASVAVRELYAADNHDRSPMEAAATIVWEAQRLETLDNTTALVVHFNRGVQEPGNRHPTQKLILHVWILQHQGGTTQLRLHCPSLVVPEFHLESKPSLGSSDALHWLTHWSPT